MTGGPDDDALFPLDAVRPAAVQPQTYAERAAARRGDLSAGRRLTLRQADLIDAGLHPLQAYGARRLEETREARFTRDDPPYQPATCGTCRLRSRGRWPKCTYAVVSPVTYAERHPRVTHGATSDVRAWWPACEDYRGDVALLAKGAAMGGWKDVDRSPKRG